MPLVDNDAGHESLHKQQPLKIYADEYKGVTVDTEYVPATALLTAITGTPLTCDYYSQVLGENSEVGGLRAEQDAVHKAYRLIKGMVLRVTTPLSYTQNDDNRFSGSGAANMFPMIIPNVGDMFLMDLGNGKEGIVQITRATRKAITRDSTYEVEYSVVAFSTPAAIADLNQKVIQSYYFDYDFLIHGQNPLVLPEDHEALRRLRHQEYPYLLNLYLRRFLNKKTSTLALPGQDVIIYDPYLVKFFISTVDVMRYPEIRPVKELNVAGLPEYEGLSIWDVFVHRERRMFREVKKTYGSFGVRSIPTISHVESIRFSGVDDAIKITEEGDVRDIHIVKDNLSSDIPEMTTKSYVLPEHFYSVTRPTPPDNKTFPLFEVMLNDFLDGKRLDPKKIDLLVKNVHEWGSVESFYYIPLLLLLIRATIRRM